MRLAHLHALWQLGKPRIVVLLTLTSAVAYTLGLSMANLPFTWAGFVWSSLGMAFSAMGANAMNMSYDRDIDQTMRRTQARPIPQNLLPWWSGYAWGVLLITLSTIILATFTHWWGAVWALAGAGFYVGIYTAWLKRRTVHNIVIGGAAGAFPPLVGWGAAVGELAPHLMWHPVPWLLFLLIFLWTPPHFWALAVLLKEDYTAANIPMLPSVAGIPEATRQSLFYTLALIPNCLALAWFLSAPFFLIGSLALVAWWLNSGFHLLRVAHNPTLARTAAKRTFLNSMWVLSGVFGLLLTAL